MHTLTHFLDQKGLSQVKIPINFLVILNNPRKVISQVDPLNPVCQSILIVPELSYHSNQNPGELGRLLGVDLEVEKSDDDPPLNLKHFIE